jgi:hypothetical protein
VIIRITPSTPALRMPLGRPNALDCRGKKKSGGGGKSSSALMAQMDQEARDRQEKLNQGVEAMYREDFDGAKDTFPGIDR